LHTASYTTSTWTFATPGERTWWGDLWADRVVNSSFAEHALAYDLTDADELTGIASAWRDWAAQADAVFFMTHGELIARGES
jgi:hypothetical protein